VRFRELSIAGAFAVESEPHRDPRGAFTRLWSRQELERRGLVTDLHQVSLSANPRAGTLRGLHYQAPPHLETKLVACLQGAIWDVVADLRQGSPTYARWEAVRLEPDPPTLLYIPAGCAHGFQTLVDGSQVLYHISAAYLPEAATGVRFDDPTLKIDWPLPVSVMSERDRALPLLT
jgi:dTDP-4-dehydrorhamnose 3,5-epimerase